MQRIHLGLDLDGERGWHARDALAESTLGPLGFLTLLEAQLGLARAQVSWAERVVQMRECLQAVRTGGRFFGASFAADEFGSASTLLAWRDLWYLHGWSGEIPNASTTRLADLGMVEQLARVRVSPGVGQRLDGIRAALGARRPQIAAIMLVDPLPQWPAAWRGVLMGLRAKLIEPEPLKPKARRGSLLESLPCRGVRMAACVCCGRNRAWRRRSGSQPMTRAISIGS